MPLAPFCLLSILLAVMLKPYLGMFSALDERVRASVVPASGEQESGAGYQYPSTINPDRRFPIAKSFLAFYIAPYETRNICRMPETSGSGSARY